MVHMYLMSGASGAGKTTFAKRAIPILEEINHREIQYLCIDDFYKVFNGSEKRHEDEFDVWIAFFQAIHLAELKGRDVLIDTNSPTISKRTEFLDWFPSFEHHLIYIEADPELCMANNAQRNRVIPPDEMKRIFDSLERPSTFEIGRWKTIQIWRNNNNESYQIVEQYKMGRENYVLNQQQI